MKADLPSNLSYCELEPIRIPGLVQPHGVLFIIQGNTDLILQAGGDTVRLLGCKGPVLGRTLQEIIGQPLKSILEAVGITPGREPVSIGRVKPENASIEFTVIAHEGREGTIVEMQPAGPTEIADRCLARVRAAADRMETVSALREACEIAAREIRKVTSYDRVMVYRFMPDATGTVVSEDCDKRLSPLLNHRFPASDIPAQARELYRQNRIRVIPDVDYTPRAILPAASPLTGEPVDMTHCTLRSVSPIHIQYLKNMGVGASMSVSLLVRGELWGLIACHNSCPIPMSFEAQEICAQLGQILSREIRVREELQRASAARELDGAREAALRALRMSGNPVEILLALGSDLQGVVRSDGIAAKFGDVVVTSGFTPLREQVRKLADWLQERIRGTDTFATDRLAEIYPAASDFASNARGLVAIMLPWKLPVILIWFRAEQIEELNWAGNPHDPAALDSGTGSLSPRRSFASWKETVRGRSRPWDQVDLESSEQFGQRAGYALQRHQILELNRDLENANARLTAITIIDGLTGIANRRAFDERLELEWKRSQRSGGTLALILLDVDFFKKYNDHNGHLAGDQCLKAVARVLGLGRRVTDLAARFGGEEFVILLPESSVDVAMRVAETVRSEIEGLGIAHPASPAGVVTVSIGFAVTTATSQDPESLISTADEALYEAKNAGRNTIRQGGIGISHPTKPTTGR